MCSNKKNLIPLLTGICTNSTAPSVSSINRILRNRAAERAAAEFARNYQLAAAATVASVQYPHHLAHPYPSKLNNIFKINFYYSTFLYLFFPKLFSFYLKLAHQPHLIFSHNFTPLGL